MDNETLLKRLIEETGIKSLKLPSGIKFSLKGRELNLKVNKGMTMNMQTNDSAFESWAVCIKFNLHKIIDTVNIEWDTNNIDVNDLHYKRFIYRLYKFTSTFSWTKCSVYDLSTYTTDGWVLNYPKIEASGEAVKPEAKLERNYIESNRVNYDCMYNQLPVGLFVEKVSKTTRATPGQNSQIDIWAIRKETLHIFELKVDSNKSVGIITELMFYVNAMNDLINGSIKLVEESKGVTTRHYDKLYEAISNSQIKRIAAYFLTNNLHPLITQNVLDGINSAYSNITFIHQCL